MSQAFKMESYYQFWRSSICNYYRTLFVLGLTGKRKVGVSLLAQKLTALFTKRVLFTYRKWLTYFLQVKKSYTEGP
jgi:hypothetical protein